MDSLLKASPSPEPTQTPPPKSPETVSQSRDRRPSPEPEHLPCPRCESTNTKFCYYNNYNLSQPRHFCKSCRRYWTRGGALRNIPVGGGTRKSLASSSNKRPRDIVTTSNNNTDDENADPGTTRVRDPVPDSVEGCWWGGGIFPLSSYGVEVGSGYDNGILNWPVEEVVERDGCAAAVPGELSGCDTWQADGGVGVAEGDYFCWPELTISTPGKAWF